MGNELTFLEQAAVAGIALSVVGLLGAHLFPKEDERRSRCVGIFLIGAGITVMSFLFNNPDLTRGITQMIALSLIGLVIATIELVAHLRR